MADIGPGLASLAVRPPTPPKESIGHEAKMVPDGVQLSHSALQSLLNTPEESPSSSAEYFGGSSEKISKRVGFSPWTEYHKHPSNTGWSSSCNHQIRALPPSRDCRSSKSILKSKSDIYSFVPTEDLMNLNMDGNISVMLEATIRHLESPVRNARLDAYSTLLGCLSAYDNIPEQQDLAGKLPDLIRFIRRDIWAKQEDNGLLDTQLATQALKLLLYFVTTPSLSGSLPDEFCALVLDELILALENPAMPKIMTIHSMQLLIQENFASQHLNNNRVNRILVALGRVTSNIKGNRIVGQRLMVYRRLLLHSKAAMITHAETWVDHLISGILSTFKEIRGRAVLFGIEASLSLGNVKTVSQTFADTLNRESLDGRKLADFLATRLTAMASVADDGFWVPQIWSIVILFLRGRRFQLERWEHLKPWLLIIQKCFNSSDAQVKYQSNRAWSRLIFAVSLDATTSPKMVKMLRQPILPQLERRTGLRGSQTAKSPKQVARSSYCTLLYYAFRPSATHTQFDQYWEEYVHQMLPKHISRSKDDVNHFCQVLAGLFSGNEPKAWDENRANINRPVRADELPCLDPKWVRKRAADVLKVFEDLLYDAEWNGDGDAEAPIILAWRSFTNAIREASSKEVKSSMETMTALAHIINTIKRFWQQGLAQRSSQRVSPVIEKIDCLLREAVSQLGFIPFNEKRLAHTKLNSYEAAETPSTRGDQHQGPLTSPVFVLLGLLIRSIDFQEIEDSYRDVIKNLIDVATRAATSRHTQLAILRDLASLAASEHDADANTRLLVWRLMAEAAMRAFNLERMSDLHVDSPQYVGHEYRDAVKILESAISLHRQETVQEWQDLGTIITQVLRQEVGSDAITLIVTEPIAKAITGLPGSDCNDFLLSAGHFLLKTVHWPQSRPAIDRARKSLWGVSLIAPKAAAVDPFDHFYTMTNFLLKTSYSSLAGKSARNASSFLSAVAAVIATCPLTMVPTLLKNTQQGIAVWIQDRDGVMAVSATSKDPSGVYAAVTSLWAAASTAIERLPKIDSGLLSIIETMIASSLKSRHKAILNNSILLWNRTFGNVDGLEYPDTLRPVLLRLRSLTDLELPNFPREDDTEEMSSPIIFLDSQIDEDTQVPQRSTPIKPPSSIRTHVQPSPSRSAQAIGNSRRSLRSSVHDQGLKTTPRARLRHNDSQIQFAAIDSSPLQPDEVESQMLTARQKEVRQRQTLEATAMFPNLGLVPKSTDHVFNGALPRLHLAGNDEMSSSPIFIGGEIPSSPTDDISDDVMGSSPTPRSRSGRFRRQPVAHPSTFLSPVVQVGSSFDVPMPSSPDAPAKVQLQTADKERDAKFPDQETPIGNDGSFPLASEQVESRLDSSAASVSQPCTPTRKLVLVKEPPKEVDGLPLSEIDVFVDAPAPERSPPVDEKIHSPISDIVHASGSPPSASRPRNESNMGGISEEPATPIMHREAPERLPDHDVSMQASGSSHVIDSFHEAETPHTPNDDDQIAAQLVSDLERASSQAEGGTRGDLPSIVSPRVNKQKRKSAPEDSDAEGGKKKSKMQPLRKRPNFHIVVDSRRAGEVDHDHVAAGAHRLSRACSPDATMEKKMRVRSTGAPFMPPRKITRRGTGRDARSSSTRTSSDHDPCSSSDETRFSAIDVKRSLSDDHSPVTGPRRSARLNRLPPARPQALPGSDAVRMISEAASPPGLFADVIAIREQKADEIDSTLPAPPGDASPGLHGISSSSKSGTEPATSGPEEEDRVGATGFDDSSPAVLAPFPDGHDSWPAEEVGWGAREEQQDDVTPLPDGSPRLLVPGHATRDRGNAAAAPEEDELGAAGILRSFRHLLENIKRVTLGVEEEREIVSVLVDSVREVHEAGRRHGQPASSSRWGK